MSSGRNDSWRQRYEAGRTRDEQRDTAWVQDHFGGPVTRTLVKELPLLLLAGLLGLLTWGWQGAVVHVALLLVVVLGFRAWARRRFLGGGRDRGR
ncbi:hypothetical protein ACI79D_07535 [Geodermatophilus sp. SYSU D00708]